MYSFEDQTQCYNGNQSGQRQTWSTQSPKPTSTWRQGVALTLLGLAAFCAFVGVNGMMPEDTKCDITNYCYRVPTTIDWSVVAWFFGIALVLGLVGVLLMADKLIKLFKEETA